MAAENCNIQPGDTVAVWGCGPVGPRSRARGCSGRAGWSRSIVSRSGCAWSAIRVAETINYEQQDVFETLQAMTGGHGPDACIDAVGLEAHGTSLDYYYDKAKTAAFLATDRISAAPGHQLLPQRRHGFHPGRCTADSSTRCRYAAFHKGPTMRMGQTT